MVGWLFRRCFHVELPDCERSCHAKQSPGRGLGENWRRCHFAPMEWTHRRGLRTGPVGSNLLSAPSAYRGGSSSVCAFLKIIVFSAVLDPIKAKMGGTLSENARARRKKMLSSNFVRATVSSCWLPVSGLTGQRRGEPVCCSLSTSGRGNRGSGP